MRVLVVTNMYPHEDDMSFGVFVKSQVESLRSEGVDVDVFTIEGFRGVINYVKAIRRLKRLDMSSYDVVHAHYGLSGAVACVAGLRPVITTFHGSDLIGLPGDEFAQTISMKGRIGTRMSRYAARKSNSVIVVSRNLKNYLPGGIVSEKIHCIPMGVDMDIFKPRPREESVKQLGLDPARRYILFPYDPKKIVKQYPVAEASVDIVKKNFEGAELLVFYGKEQIELALAMNACEALLLPSAWEGSPCSVKEALASNLPIVATDVGDVRERVQNVSHCHIVDQEPEECADALSKILRARERSDGREAVQDLSLRATAKNIVSLYEKLMEESK